MMRCLAHPLCLFLLIWSVATTLYLGGVVNGLFPPPATITVVSLVLNVVAFVLGYLTWTLFRGLRPAPNPSVTPAARPLTRDTAARLLKLTLLAGVAILLLDVYRIAGIAHNGGMTWLELVTHPEQLRIRLIASIGGSVFQTSGVVMLLSIMGALFWTGFVLLGVYLYLERTWRRYLYLVAFLAVGLTFSLMHVSRCEATACILFLVFGYGFMGSTDRSGRDIRTPASSRFGALGARLNLLIPAAAVVLLFAIVDVLLHKSSTYDQPNQLQGFLFHLYWYIASPLAAFNEFVTTFTSDYLWGQNTFFPLYKWLCRLHLIRETEVAIYREFLTIPYAANVYTYLRAFYEDFGILGIAIVPYALGWATAAIRVQARRRLQFLILYLVLLLSIFFSFYNHFLNLTQAYLQVFFGFVLFRYELPGGDADDDFSPASFLCVT